MFLVLSICNFKATNITKIDNNFYFHLNVFKTTLCVPYKVVQNGKTVLTLLSSHNLDLQCSHFKMTLIHNFEVVMHDSKSNLNPMTRL